MMVAATTAVRLLLVEDDPDASDAISRVLEKQGFDVETCASAGAALVRLQTQPKPGAAIVDLRLPDASGGIILWRIRRDYRRRRPRRGRDRPARPALAAFRRAQPARRRIPEARRPEGAGGVAEIRHLIVRATLF